MFANSMNQILLRESVSTVSVIMITGVVGLQSRLASDRDWTLGLVERDYNFIAEQCSYFGGRVIKATDGGVIATFKTATDAVQCALDSQKTLTRAAASMQPKDILNHAIGIHYGELVVSGTEISGSGVVIANRLQLGANWGTIHISEAIYEQVRNVPEQPISYVGERYLLRVYQLLPKGFSSAIPQLHPQSYVDLENTEIPNELINSDPEAARHIFDQVIEKLNQHSNINEIKQIILFICLQKWEVELPKLQKINLKGLVQELIELTGTISELNALVQDALSGLDTHYLGVGTVILSTIDCLYPDYQPLPQNIYEEVAQSLTDPNKDILRIKKLVFHVCRYDLPDQYISSFSGAIQAIQQLYPNLETLRNRLKLAIANKPEYNEVVDMVVDELSAIYPTRSVAGATFIESIPAISNTADHGVNDSIPLVDSNHGFANDNKVNQKSIDQKIANLDLFDLRLEIIKYLSPLRAKILIFSTLNNVAESTNESISAIRTFELDDLLRDLFYAYKNPKDLEVELNNTAKQFKDVDEYEQAATVIMNAVRSIYNQIGIAS